MQERIAELGRKSKAAAEKERLLREKEAREKKEPEKLEDEEGLLPDNKKKKQDPREQDSGIAIHQGIEKNQRM